MVHMMWTAVSCLLLFSLVHQYRSDACSVPDPGQYYDVNLDETYEIETKSDAIAQALFKGPLMREGNPWGIGGLKRLFDRKPMSVRRIHEIVKGHLYGESKEFRNLLERLEEQYGTQEASHQVLTSICEAFELSPRSQEVLDRDACLIADGKAHWVVTKIIVAYLELGDDKLH